MRFSRKKKAIVAGKVEVGSTTFEYRLPYLTEVQVLERDNDDFVKEVSAYLRGHADHCKKYGFEEVPEEEQAEWWRKHPYYFQSGSFEAGPVIQWICPLVVEATLEDEEGTFHWSELEMEDKIRYLNTEWDALDLFRFYLELFTTFTLSKMKSQAPKEESANTQVKSIPIQE